jgi:hypothetical protein
MEDYGENLQKEVKLGEETCDGTFLGNFQIVNHSTLDL